MVTVVGITRAYQWNGLSRYEPDSPSTSSGVFVRRIGLVLNICGKIHDSTLTNTQFTNTQDAMLKNCFHLTGLLKENRTSVSNPSLWYTHCSLCIFCPGNLRLVLCCVYTLLNAGHFIGGVFLIHIIFQVMLTSSNRNIFRITDPVGNSQRPVTPSFEAFSDLRLN